MTSSFLSETLLRRYNTVIPGAVYMLYTFILVHTIESNTFIVCVCEEDSMFIRTNQRGIATVTPVTSAYFMVIVKVLMMARM